ncbi:MAG: signal recognition particle protein [Alphaproteobacteria bacterium]|nr:MAG: signal recognition particle protein [Alphaproteobacteria bacterium]
MFDTLSQRLGSLFERLTRQGVIGEAEIDAALREVRIALLEADVALPVAKDLIAKARERALGTDVLRGVAPGQQVIKIFHDVLVETLGEAAQPLRLAGEPPIVILMAGLQGSGKTTTTAKLAVRLSQREGKKAMVASLDVTRPAAQEQLAILAQQGGVPSLPIVPGEGALDIARRALVWARQEGADVLFLDTAGRMETDDGLMAEIAAVAQLSNPAEILLVADAMMGQASVGVAQRFQAAVALTGIVLTRMDGDARGGAALSMRAVTGCPVKFLGLGEKLDAIEPFHPDRLASRILGMGDVVSLVEKAAENIDQEKAEKLARKLSQNKGDFDLDDLADQLKQMKRMGGLSGLLGFLPGMGGMMDQLRDAKLDEGVLRRQEAILSSMTPRERRYPDLLKNSRKLRIARGSGASVEDINRLLRQFEQMRRMMKKLHKLGPTGLSLPPMAGMPGGMAPGRRFR